MAVDLREVARRSGVSIATVSRALNGRPEVSDETRARVTDIARELGYLPNQQARTLVRRRSDTVGLIWDTTYIATKGRQPFLQDLMVGLKIALANTGFHLLLLSPPAAESEADAFVRAAWQHSLDGVVLLSVNQNWPAVDALIKSGRPCVGLDLPIRGHRASFVTTDGLAGAAAAVAHLRELGHRRIATISGPPDQLPAIQRLEGFFSAMADLGLAVPHDYVRHGDFFYATGYECMQQLLRLAEPPTGVFVAADSMAIGAVQAISDAGLRVPDDISIVGFDDTEEASLVRPALTTVAQDWLELGEAAVLLLTGLMDRQAGNDATAPGPDAPADEWPAPSLVPGHLIVRDTTAAAPRD